MTVAILVTAVAIPEDGGLRKFRSARKIFAIAGALMSALIFSCVIVGYVHPYDKLAILMTASYQALLLINMITVFINPDAVRLRSVIRDTLYITAVMAVPYLMLWLCPAAFRYTYWAAAAFYLSQLVSYSRYFILSFKKVIRLTDEYYAENNAQRLAWVHRIFLSSLAVGVWAFVCLFVKSWSYLVLMPALIGTYFMIAINIINYATKSAYLVSALNASSGKADSPAPPCEENASERGGTAIPEKMRAAIRERLDVWVAEKGYMEKDVPYAETLARIGVDVVTMRRYMKDELGTDFRTWRNSLKLEEACRLFAEHPEMSVEQISDRVGYNDSSNFHKDFKKRYGMSPSLYRKTFAR